MTTSTINIDKEKVHRMAVDAIRMFDNTGANYTELVAALGQAVGRTIIALGEMGMSDINKRALVDLAVGEMARAIDAKQSRIITN
jgi:hypothetical protein